VQKWPKGSKDRMAPERFIIHIVCAARPNFMKAGPLFHALKDEPWANPLIVHTGQHYDSNMSDVFFKDLELPNPHLNLNVGSGTHAEQTGHVMSLYEKILMESPPDLVVVVGDVNSTMAATLAATKLGVKVAHLEAGLRSFDRSMPEEINRLVTDVLADRLWTPSPDADDNLKREGVSPSKICQVGNIMIDCIEMFRGRINEAQTYRGFGLAPKGYGLVTLHRPANVDNSLVLSNLCNVISSVALRLPLVFPVHPRTRKTLEANSLINCLEMGGKIILPPPISYIPFMSCVSQCQFVITDSGGIQEETTYLGIPCLTIRPNTERPITVTQGTNQLCGLGEVEALVDRILAGQWKKGRKIDLWDGKTAGRITDDLKDFLTRGGV